MSFNNPFDQFFSKDKGKELDKVPEIKAESEPKIPAGEYKVRATFINRKGERITQNIDFPVRISTPATQEEMEKKATNEVSFLGLHNFGMDIYVERYPDGHPVTIEVLDKEGNPVINYTQVFNASGHPVI